MTRKAIHMTTVTYTSNDGLGHNALSVQHTAICDDGTMWTLNSYKAGWQPMPEIPQDE